MSALTKSIVDFFTSETSSSYKTGASYAQADGTGESGADAANVACDCSEPHDALRGKPSVTGNPLGAWGDLHTHVESCDCTDGSCVEVSFDDIIGIPTALRTLPQLTEDEVTLTFGGSAVAKAEALTGFPALALAVSQAETQVLPGAALKPVTPGMPHDNAQRKQTPLFHGFRVYFPDAICEVAKCSFVANEQHNPGEPLHWARGKSMNQLDTADRHLTDYAMGKRFDDKGVRILAQVAWRILAQIQLDVEAELTEAAKAGAK